MSEALKKQIAKYEYDIRQMVAQHDMLLEHLISLRLQRQDVERKTLITSGVITEISQGFNKKLEVTKNKLAESTTRLNRIISEEGAKIRVKRFTCPKCGIYINAAKEFSNHILSHT